MRIGDRLVRWWEDYHQSRQDRAFSRAVLDLEGIWPDIRETCRTVSTDPNVLLMQILYAANPGSPEPDTNDAASRSVSKYVREKLGSTIGLSPRVAVPVPTVVVLHPSSIFGLAKLGPFHYQSIVPPHVKHGMFWKGIRGRLVDRPVLIAEEKRLPKGAGIFRRDTIDQVWDEAMIETWFPVMPFSDPNLPSKLLRYTQANEPPTILIAAQARENRELRRRIRFGQRVEEAGRWQQPDPDEERY